MTTNAADLSRLPINPAISRMRALCALLVALGHYKYGLFSPDWNHSYYAVTVFFTISGFLITTNVLLLDGSLDAVDFRRFYAKRLSRIFPPLLLLIAALSLGHWAGVGPFVFSKESCGLKSALYAVFTLRFNKLFTATSATLPEMWGVLWSLTIEEVFYLVFPPLCKILPTRFIYRLAGILVLVGIINRHLSANGGLYDFFSCFDALSLGVVTALLAQKYSCLFGSRFDRLILPYVIFFAAVVYAKMPPVPPYTTFAPLLIAILSSITLFIVSKSRSDVELIQFDPLVLLGNYSYEIYLFHGAIISALISMMAQASDTTVFALSVPLVLAGSALVATWFSEPIKDYTRGRILRVLRQLNFQLLSRTRKIVAPSSNA